MTEQVNNYQPQRTTTCSSSAVPENREIFLQDTMNRSMTGTTPSTQHDKQFHGEQSMLSNAVLDALHLLQQPSLPTTSHAKHIPEPREPRELQQPHATQPTLPQMDRLWALVEKTPTDADSWMQLIEAVESAGVLNSINTVYENLLKAYPHNVRPVHILYIWLLSNRRAQPYVEAAYMRHCINNNQLRDPTEQFETSMTNGHGSVAVALIYISYIKWVFLQLWMSMNVRLSQCLRKLKGIPSDKVRKAYALAVDAVGHDRDSFHIWHGYISYLEACQVLIHHSAYP